MMMRWKYEKFHFANSKKKNLILGKDIDFLKLAIL